MWAAPFQANAQIVVEHENEADLVAIKCAIEQALACILVPYPPEFFASNGTTRQYNSSDRFGSKTP